MKRRSFCYAFVIVPFLAGTILSADWKAGVAKVNITPQENMWLAGYAGRNHASEGVLLDLWAKALVLEDADGNHGVLITADLLEFPKQLSDRIRQQLNDKLGWDKAQIILNASHTHSGPVVLHSALSDMYLPFNTQEKEKIDRYGHQLEQRIVDMVVEASQSLEPVTLAAANGIARVQVNRRNNAEGRLTSLTELKGPNDYAVPVLKVTDASGQIKAIAFGYACHPTVLDIYLWSGDYPGFAQAELEKWYPGTTALFFQGAGADMNPLPRRSIPLARQYGITLAAAVDRTLQENMKALPATLKTAYKEVALPLDTPYSEDHLAEIAQNGPNHLKRYAQRFLDQIQNGETLMRSYPYPVQAWNIGGWPLFTLGGELTLGYAIELKQKYGEDTFVLGFTNDVMGYIPTLTILKEGGYEGATSQLEYGLPGLWAPEIESVIYEATDELANQTGIVPRAETN
ncbi:MAG: neutral/alkaline non-lysosomal ceramidase N-terminal domain-containing protein [Planctomycetaceae bacterium]|nr:neutral/alkaline non-lysosomal ceramidase N-terminal domain-containing protein [Planctomycetaceae bacterium]